MFAVGCAAATARGGDKRPACRTQHQVLASGHDVVAWSRRHYGEIELIGCLRRTDRRTILTSADVVFGPPAKDVEVAGPLVAYAVNAIADAGLSDSTVLRVADLRHRNEAIYGRSEFEVDRGELVRVGSVAVDRRRRLAWIECPDADQQSEPATVQPNCVHAGDSMNTVYVVAGKHARLAPVQLDAGEGVDPRSVAIHGGKVYWTRDGKRRHAAVPLA